MLQVVLYLDSVGLRLNTPFMNLVTKVNLPKGTLSTGLTIDFNALLAEFTEILPTPVLQYSVSRGVVRRRQIKPKAAFEILAKCLVFSLLLSQHSIEKRGSETPSELLIP